MNFDSSSKMSPANSASGRRRAGLLLVAVGIGSIVFGLLDGFGVLSSSNSTTGMLGPVMRWLLSSFGPLGPVVLDGLLGISALAYGLLLLKSSKAKVSHGGTPHNGAWRNAA